MQAEVQKLVRGAAAKNTTGSQLAALVDAVPGLNGRLRSYAEARSNRVDERTDTERIPLLLGPRLVELVALQHVLIEEIGSLELPPLVVEQLHLDFVRRAVAARAIGPSVHIDAETAFTAGFASELGIALLLARRPLYGKWYGELRGLRGRVRLVREAELFGTNHAAIFGGWADANPCLPEWVGRMSTHHVDTAGDVEADPLLASVAWADELVSALAAPTGRALDDWVDDITTVLQLPPEPAWKIMERVIRESGPAARDLGLNLPAQATVAQLKAARRSDPLGMPEPELRALLTMLHEEAAALDRACRELEERGGGNLGVDPVTSLPDHSAHLRAVARVLGEVVGTERPVWLLRVDIDHFSELNARFGFPVGDQVLRALADTLRRVLVDAKGIARVGSDSFGAIVLEDGWRARLTAERVRAAIEETVVEVGHTRMQVTATVYLLDRAHQTVSGSAGGFVTALERMMRLRRSSGGNSVVRPLIDHG